MPWFGRKKKDKSSKDCGEEGTSTMPFFRHQSEKCKKRQQYQGIISLQDPEPRYDLSACEMSKVPSNVFSECKMLLKEVLLLHDNWLTDLGPEGEEGIADITRLKVLDAHNNSIKRIPNDFGNLSMLEILDLSGNKLKVLPQSFENLNCLQTLKLKANRFKEFPSCICRLKCLRTLDISCNEITNIPAEFCYSKAIDTLVMDVDKMTYPPSEICRKGTGAAMMYLCGEAGVEYEHPSKYWLRINRDGRRKSEPSTAAHQRLSQMEADSTEGYQAYQNALDQKRRDAAEMERVFQQEQEIQTQLAMQVAAEKRQQLSTMTENDNILTKDLDAFTVRREEERQVALQTLIDDERQFSDVIKQLLDFNAKAKEQEQLLKHVEEERLREEEWFVVRVEEYQNVRKQEVLDAMQLMLTEFASIEKARISLEMDSEESRRDALEQVTFDEEFMEQIVSLRHQEHQKVVDKLAEEEGFQKAAFEALLLSRDSTVSRIRQQISLIEAELSQLSKIEMEQRELQKKQEIDHLCDERIALSALLAQLLQDEEKRKIELKQRLTEMEEQREDGQADYWLVQYQRLLDWKPQALIDKETHLEKVVKEVLEASGGSEYTATFARHRITVETLQTLTDDDLRIMGIHQIGIRRSILKNIDLMTNDTASGREKVKAILKESLLPPLDTPPATTSDCTEPSAPPPSLPPMLIERQQSFTARGLNSECVICMETESCTIFLPCGHICCCGRCSASVKDCPLCRAPIQGRVKLTMPSSPKTF